MVTALLKPALSLACHGNSTQTSRTAQWHDQLQQHHRYAVLLARLHLSMWQTPCSASATSSVQQLRRPLLAFRVAPPHRQQWLRHRCGTILRRGQRRRRRADASAQVLRRHHTFVSLHSRYSTSSVAKTPAHLLSAIASLNLRSEASHIVQTAATGLQSVLHFSI